MKKRLGEILLERGLIDVDQLNSALAHQRQWGMRLGTALVAKGFIAEGILTRVLSESLGIPMVDLARVVADQKALQLLTSRVCEQYDVFPIALKEQKGRRLLLLAMADPLNVAAIDEIAFTTGCTVKPAIAQISSLGQALRRFYHGQKVQIAPLSFDRAPPRALENVTHPPISSGPEDESMTIITAGGKEEMVVGPRLTGAGVIHLTEEITERTARAEVEKELARRQRNDAATMPPQADPFAPQASPPSTDVYGGMPTGTFAMPPPTDPGVPVTVDQVLTSTRAADQEALEGMEKKFWALMRVLARRGLVTKEEFLAELRWHDEVP